MAGHAEARPEVASAEWKAIEGADREVSRLNCGDAVRFGFCRCGRCAVDIRVPLPGVSGEIRTDDAVCWLANTSAHVTLSLWDLEDPAQRLRLEPNRPPLPIPFELAEIAVAGLEHRPFVTVFGPDPVARAALPAPCRPGRGIRLDRSSRYYAVLSVLCAARMTSTSVTLPTSPEVAHILNDRGIPITSRAVDHHVDYLVRLLRLDDLKGAHRGSAWKREAVVDSALALGLLDP